jgi:hypothetical protein
MGSLRRLIVAALTTVPMWKLLERDGINPIRSLVSITGIGFVLLLWILAFRSPGKVA